MLCYLRPFADTRLTLIGRVAYTMANCGWCLGMLLWALVSYVMIGWIVFQVWAAPLTHVYSTSERTTQSMRSSLGMHVTYAALKTLGFIA